MLKKIRSKQKWQAIFLISAIFSFFILLPISIKLNKDLATNEFYFFVLVFFDLIIAFTIQYLFFLLFFSIKFFGIFFYVINILTSIAICYFFIFFGKNIDPWVVGDILENIALVSDFVSIKLILILLIFIIIFSVFAILIFKAEKNFYKSKTFLRFHSFLIICLLSIIIFDNALIRKIKKNYPPLSVISSSIKFLEIKNSKEINEISSKKSQSLDLIAQDKIFFKGNESKEEIVIFVIGESTRNDYFFELLPKFSPFLSKNKNVVLFNDTKACSTLTRKSVPCLLTNVSHKNWADFINSVNVIDVFNKANFYSSWIDNQSLYGVFDSSYSMLAKSCDKVIEEKNFNIKSDNNYDENLLPHIKFAVENQNENKKNKFISAHLLGSHWHIEARYNKDFQVFKNICEAKKDITQCSNEQLKNSYKNSVIYGFRVLEDVIKLVENKNAIVIFTPDHGFSLGENGRFGNASEDNPIEQISVPMLIWYSDEFKKLNSKIINNLQKNKNKKITHENVFHSLIGCANIESKYVDKKLNLCN